jgi:hypothetical protein
LLVGRKDHPENVGHSSSGRGGLRGAERARGRNILIGSIAALMLAAVPAAAAAKGGSGVVTPFRVGPVTMNRSTAADARAFAGNPDRVFQCVCSGGTFKTFIYRFSGHGQTSYAFKQFPDGSWRLEGFDTNLQRFRSQRGTRVGMTVGQAQHHERLSYRSGCVPGLIRSVKQSNRQDTFIVATYFGHVQFFEVDGPLSQGC